VAVFAKILADEVEGILLLGRHPTVLERFSDSIGNISGTFKANP
jgi:hypothetical protein